MLGGTHFHRETTRSERERAERSPATHGAPKPIAIEGAGAKDSADVAPVGAICCALTAMTVMTAM